MTIKDRINDVNKLGIFNSEEVEENDYNESRYAVLKSIEYYQIFHLTNMELYYLDEETENLLNEADLVEDTEKGRIYCYN